MTALREQLKLITHDAILWLSTKLWQQAVTPLGQEQAIKQVMDLLLTVGSQVRRDAYIKNVCSAINTLVGEQRTTQVKLSKTIDANEKRLSKLTDAAERNDLQNEIAESQARLQKVEECLLPELPVKELVKYLKAETDQRAKERKAKLQSKSFDAHGDHNPEAEEWDDGQDPWTKCPPWIDAQAVKEQGFSLVNSKKNGSLVRMGYYTFNPKDKQHEELTNFSITPIFHIRSGRDSRHMIEIDNGYKKAVLDLESKYMVSPDLLMYRCVDEGNFVIRAAKLPWLRIASQLLQNFRECLEIQFLGWQKYGFYAFINGIFVPETGFIPADEWGVVEFEGKNFLIPSASAVYRTAVSTEDDPYENDRPMEYFLPKISFNQWAVKMQEVYLDKGLTAVAYCVLSTFRDIVFSLDNNFPHLYGFGEKSSGKSAWAQSVSNFFFLNRPAFQLPSGTDFAFFRYMGNFKNAVSFLNEFDEKTTKPEWFQAIKGVFDGEGRQRGSMANKGKIETMKVESGLVLAGQYLVTADDNSVVTRSIIEAFSERTLTNEERKIFMELRGLEAHGLTGLLTELVSHRKFFKDEFKTVLSETVVEWRDNYKGGSTFNQRLMQNWAYLYTALYLATRKINMPGVDIVAFKRYCFERGTHWCKFIRSSDTLSEFWNTLLFLVESKQVVLGWDIRIETVKSVTIRKNREETFEKRFLEPTKILYLRLNNIHKMYEQTYRSRTGKQGMSMENLLHYFSSRGYYVGAIQNIRWGRKVHGEAKMDVKITNGYAFLYNDLDLDIESSTEYMAVTKHNEEEAAAYLQNAAEDLPFGKT